MGKHIYRIISCIAVLVLLIVSITVSSAVLERKSAKERCKGFFDQKENYDVLFFGTSHMINAVYPMELWEDYGIVSYNLAGHGMNISTSYWMMINALDYTTPRLVVIDCMLLNGYGRLNPALSHLSLDVFPFSINKVRMMQDMTKDTDEQIEYLFDFSIYHSRWTELTKEDFLVDYKTEKGAETRNYVADVPGFKWSIGDRKFDVEKTTGIVYLGRMIEECQKRDIDVLLTYVPFPASEDEQLESNRVPEIAEEYGVNYLNFLRMDTINYVTDCSDSNSHLNGSGARKVTDYLGKFIRNEYEIPDQRGNSGYSDWSQAYEKYKAFKKRNFQEQCDFDVYLSMLADSHYITIVSVGENIKFGAKTQALLKNINIAENPVAERMVVDYRNGYAKPIDVQYHSNNIDILISESKIMAGGTVCDVKPYDMNAVNIIVLDAQNGYVVDNALFRLEGNSLNRKYE